MSRSIPEWRGRSDDAMPPRSVFDRLWERQGGRDAVTGLPFTSSDRIVRDHIVPLADGGLNIESNLQLITENTHKHKTAAEATERASVRRHHENARGYVRKKSSFQTNRDGPYRKRMDGTIEPRRVGGNPRGESPKSGV